MVTGDEPEGMLSAARNSLNFEIQRLDHEPYLATHAWLDELRIRYLTRCSNRLHRCRSRLGDILVRRTASARVTADLRGFVVGLAPPFTRESRTGSTLTAPLND